MTRLRRAPLFIPADSPRKIEKGLTLDADAIILELEDGVAVSRKTEARQIAAHALQTYNFGRAERLVRINASGTGLTDDDLAATLPARPDGYIIPKVDSAQTIRAIDQKIGQFEATQNWPAGQIKLLALVETAQGVLNLPHIAAAAARLDALILGAEDLAADIGAVRTRAGWETFYAKSALVIAAAAFGLDAIDTPCLSLQDPERLRAEARQAAELGYCGKLAIHPAQLEPLHQIFTPAPDAVSAARRLLNAFDAHQHSGRGVFTLDGKMVDMPLIRAAQKIIQKIEAINDRAR
ncbi:MAG: HpcH/HpaI aldolase/citrate lyase family protein [Anaerolineae bacterium]